MPAPDAPAPPGLDAIEAFLNSIELDSGSESLSSPEAATAWLREHGLLGGADRVEAAGLPRLVAVREGLRALALANNGCAPDEDAVAGLEQAAGVVRLRPALAGDAGIRLEPVEVGADGVIARLLAAAAAAHADRSWSRLKACRDRSCGWAFVDASRNSSRAWCTMGVCGNRAKARRFRSRQQNSRATAPVRQRS